MFAVGSVWDDTVVIVGRVTAGAEHANEGNGWGERP